jgi:hypothetical protein
MARALASTPIVNGIGHALRTAARRRFGNLKFGINDDTISAWR